MPNRIEINEGREWPTRHQLTHQSTMPMLSMIAAAVCLAVSSCTSAPPGTMPVAPPATTPVSPRQPPPAKPAKEEQAKQLTIAERAARKDAIARQDQPAPESSSTLSAGRDYQDGYPVLAPPPKPRADGSLQSFLALNTGPYLANSHIHDLKWTNNSRRPLAIYKAYVWTGVDKGGIADVHIEARRASDDSYIAILQWDHYADPTLPQHGQQFDYASPMMLDPGDSIMVRHFANGFTPGWHAHHYLILWVK